MRLDHEAFTHKLKIRVSGVRFTPWPPTLPVTYAAAGHLSKRRCVSFV
jgi:hypothetical protein